MSGTYLGECTQQVQSGITVDLVSAHSRYNLVSLWTLLSAHSRHNLVSQWTLVQSTFQLLLSMAGPQCLCWQSSCWFQILHNI